MKIAIVEDEAESRDRLISYIKQYEAKKNISFSIAEYSSGITFLADYRADVDIVLMDIQMPNMDGMTAAKKLREKDEGVCLIFITQMASYAIKGYEVSALDFMIKPVRYANLSSKLDRAVERRIRQKKREISISLGNDAKRVPLSEVLYIEVSNHTLIYHTIRGTISVRGVIKDEEERLKDNAFARCSNSFLVNLAKVTTAQKNVVVIGNKELKISRSKRDAFMRALADFVGGSLQ